MSWGIQDVINVCMRYEWRYTRCNFCQTSNIKHLCRQLKCWSIRCSRSMACQHCSKYIFILDLTPGFNRLGKDNCKMRREASQCWELVQLVLEVWWYSLQCAEMCVIMWNSEHADCIHLTHWSLWDDVFLKMSFLSRFHSLMLPLFDAKLPSCEHQLLSLVQVMAWCC